MTNPAVKDEPQLALGERVIEDATLLYAIQEQQNLKAAAAGAHSSLKGLIEGKPDLRGKFRVGPWVLNVRYNIAISVAPYKAPKVKLPKAAKAKPLPEAETVPMSVDGRDGQPVRRPRGRPRRDSGITGITFATEEGSVTLTRDSLPNVEKALKDAKRRESNGATPAGATLAALNGEAALESDAAADAQMGDLARELVDEARRTPL